MGMKLPEPDHRRLENPELPLVVWQVRFGGGPTDIGPSQKDALQSHLSAGGWDLPQVEEVSSSEFVLSPQGPTETHTSMGWRLGQPDSGWSVVVLPGSVAIETDRFRSFADELMPRLKIMVAALEGSLSPGSIQRIGLRFVNLLTSPRGAASAQEWRPLVHQDYAAAVHSDDLVDGVEVLEQRMRLRGGDDSIDVRSGLVYESDKWRFLLDIDASTHPRANWSGADVLSISAKLNKHCVSVFQHAISSEMLQALRTGDMEGRGL